MVFLKNKNIYFQLILSFFLLTSLAFAGTFIPSPASPEASSYTLSDIYNKLTIVDYSASAHDFSTTTTPASTYVTLTDIWNAIPDFVTLAENDLDTGILPAGLYASTTDLSTIETNLIAANIATGTTIFGVVGTCEENVVPEPDPEPDLYVFGALTPDATGEYFENGIINGYMSYVNSTTDAVIIWSLYEERYDLSYPDIPEPWIWNQILGTAGDPTGSYSPDGSVGTAYVTDHIDLIATGNEVYSGNYFLNGTYNSENAYERQDGQMWIWFNTDIWEWYISTAKGTDDPAAISDAGELVGTYDTGAVTVTTP